MRKVLCSLVVLAILVGMFVCLGVQAFADDEPTAAIYAVSGQALTEEQITKMKSADGTCDVLVVDVDGLDAEQSGKGYSVVYAAAAPSEDGQAMQKAQDEGFVYIWPDHAVEYELNADTNGYEPCQVMLVGVGPESTSEGISAAINSFDGVENVCLIAVGPSTANFQAAVEAGVAGETALILTNGDVSVETAVIKAGQQDNLPVSRIAVNTEGKPASAGFDLAALDAPETGSKTVTYYSSEEKKPEEMVTESLPEGSSYPLPGDKFTKEGFGLTGWKVDGTEDERYDVGYNYTVSDDVAFIAEWTASASPVPEVTEYTISFQPGDGATGEMASVKVKGGESYSLPQSCEFSCEGSSFIGWKLSTDDYATLYQVFDPVEWTYSEQSVTVESDITAVAQWQKQVQQVTVSFESGLEGVEVSGFVDPATMDAGSDYVLPANGFTASGYEFTGWDVNGETKQPNDHITVNDYLTVTAQWKALEVVEPGPEATETPEEPQNYNVTYNPNAETYTGEMPPVQIAAGQTHTLAACAYAVEGMDFTGWTVNNGTETLVDQQPGTVITVNSDTVVTAQWAAKPETFTVTYKANGGAGEDVVLDGQAKDSTITLQASAFTAPEGQTFAHWTVENGDGTAYPAGSNFIVTGDVTFLAAWEPMTGQDPGATSNIMLTYIQGTAEEPSMSFSNAKIASVAVDNQTLTAGQQYALTNEDKTVTLNNEYLDTQSTGDHVVSVTFQQDSNGGTFQPVYRNINIQPPAAVSDTPSSGNVVSQDWDRGGAWSYTFTSAPTKLEIYYGENNYVAVANSGTATYYQVSGNTLTIYPALVNGSWGGAVWPNGSYRFQVTLGDGTQWTLQLKVGGTAVSTISNPTETPANTQGGAPVTGDNTPLTLMIVILVVLIVALAVVVFIVVKRKNAQK